MIQLVRPTEVMKEQAIPDDRRSYTEGKQECIECLLKEADVWKSTLF